MAKKQKEQPVLTLDGKEYFAGDMTDEQLRIKDHLADLSNKMNTNVSLLTDNCSPIKTFVFILLLRSSK